MMIEANMGPLLLALRTGRYQLSPEWIELANRKELRERGETVPQKKSTKSANKVLGVWPFDLVENQGGMVHAAIPAPTKTTLCKTHLGVGIKLKIFCDDWTLVTRQNL
eukprot:5111116-Amphidinium_carterae.11